MTENIFFKQTSNSSFNVRTLVEFLFNQRHSEGARYEFQCYTMLTRAILYENQYVKSDGLKS